MAFDIMPIDDKEIEAAFYGTDFGPMVRTTEQKRKAVAKAVLKRTCDYATGRTMACILQRLGLTKTLQGKPTKAGRRWMYDVLTAWLKE